MKVCGVCGKRIAVMWPEFWVYKHGKGEDTTYYCSENCMIVADTREMKDRIGWVDPQAEMTEEEIEAVTHGRPVGFRRLRKTARRDEQPAAPAGQERTGQEMGNSRNAKKLTREEKEKAVELAIAGKDPIGYLKECGCKNPWASWAYIKQTLKKAKPEKYAQLPGDEDRLGEEVSFGAKGIQTAAAGGEPAVPAAETEKADDALAGFVAYDPGAPEGDKAADLVINAEDLAAAEDPAVARMEALAAETKTDRVPDVDAGERPAAVARDPSTSVGMTAQGVLKDRSELIHDAHGIRMVTERLLDDLPCAITGLKVNEFEFNLNRAGMVLILPESDRDFLQLRVTLTPDQWKRLVEVVPKVMKILRIE